MIRVKFKTLKGTIFVMPLDRLGMSNMGSCCQVWQIGGNDDDTIWLISPATFEALAAINPAEHIHKIRLKSDVGVAVAFSPIAALIDLTDADEKAVKS